MATVLEARGAAARRSDAPRAVICGSFRRAGDPHIEDFLALVSARRKVLSPTDVNFVKAVNGLALATDEIDDSPQQIESRHVDGLQAADFVQVQMPRWYVGLSAALEVGVADGFGIPVFRPRGSGGRHIGSVHTSRPGPCRPKLPRGARKRRGSEE